jgi:long-subunit acyl-CoA synthetase (AMP-forming)
MMLRYWNKPDATAQKVRNGWLRTGDLATARRWANDARPALMT